MRQTKSFAMPGRILAVVVLLIASMIMAAAPGSMVEAQSTPNSAPAPDPIVTLISLVEVPIDFPPEGEESPPYLMYVTRVDLPAKSATGGDDHTSVSFTVAVTAGSICYKTELPGGATATAIFANPDDATATHPGCSEARTDLDCDIDDEARYACALNDGDTVYLSVNTAVEHEGEAFHDYRNPDTADHAQVLITGIEAGGGAGCRGGCM